MIADAHDRLYHARRVEQELRFAARAAGDVVARIHADLAALHCLRMNDDDGPGDRAAAGAEPALGRRRRGGGVAK